MVDKIKKFRRDFLGSFNSPWPSGVKTPSEIPPGIPYYTLLFLPPILYFFSICRSFPFLPFIVLWVPLYWPMTPFRLDFLSHTTRGSGQKQVDPERTTIGHQSVNKQPHGPVNFYLYQPSGQYGMKIISRLNTDRVILFCFNPVSERSLK